MRWVIVQARDVQEFLAASFFEAFFDFLVDLFQCLDAIRRKGGRADSDVLDPVFFGQARHFFYGVRFQPLFGAKF